MKAKVGAKVGRGRPKKPALERRSHFITLRLTKDEKKDIETAASFCGKKPVAMVREVALTHSGFIIAHAEDVYKRNQSVIETSFKNLRDWAFQAFDPSI